MENQQSFKTPVPNRSIKSFQSFKQYDFLDYGLESLDSKVDDTEGPRIIIVEPDENALNSYLAIFSELSLLSGCSFFTDPDEGLNTAVTLL